MNLLDLNDDVLLKIFLNFKKSPSCIYLYPTFFRINKYFNNILTDQAIFRAVIYNYRDMCLELYMEAHHQQNKYLELKSQLVNIEYYLSDSDTEYYVDSDDSMTLDEFLEGGATG